MIRSGRAIGLATAIAATSACAGTASAATINVTTTADAVVADSQCSLREAVNAAQGGPSSGCTPGEAAPDVIRLPAGTYTLTGAGNESANGSGDLDIQPFSGDLTISGAGRGSTTIASNGTDRLLEVVNFGFPVASNYAVTDLTMTGGRAPAGAPSAFGQAGQSGGAILSGSNLDLRNVALIDNRAGNGGNSTDPAAGGGPGGDGGAISLTGGSLSVSDSTLRANRAGNAGVGSGASGGHGGNGGAIASSLNFFLPGAPSPAVRVISSTFNDNRAGDGSGTIGMPGGGGAIRVFGSLSLRNSTLTGNQTGTGGGAAIGPGGGAVQASSALRVRSSTISGNVASVTTTIPGGGGGGIAIAGGNRDEIAEISNTIVAGNSGGAAPDIVTGARRPTLEFSLIGDGSGAQFDELGGNQIGTAAAPISPQLGALADNGGPTQTMAPAATSPALDAGNSGGLFVDQRGEPRPVDYPGVAGAANGTGADIGAFELAAPPPSDPDPPVVDTIAPVFELDGKAQVKANPDKPPKKLKLTATSDENCNLAATGTIKIPQIEKNGKAAKAKRFDLTATSASLAAAVPAKLKLKLDKKVQQALGEALAAGETSKAKVVATCADAAGNSGSDRFKAKVVPKG